MKLTLSIVLLGCSFILPVIAHKHKRNWTRHGNSTRHKMNGQCATCGISSQHMQQYTGNIRVPKEFHDDAELYKMSIALPENQNDPEAYDGPEIDPQRISLPVVLTRSARRAQCGPYTFVNTIIGSPDMICGTLGLLSAGGDHLTGKHAECAKKCNYTFHKSKLCLSGGNSCSRDDSSSDSKSNSRSSSSSSSSKGCKDDCSFSLSASCDHDRGVWKKRCRRVTLCKAVECSCCLAPTQLNFEDLCPTLGADPGDVPPYDVFFYRGFLLYGGEVINAEPCCNGGRNLFESAIISPMNVLKISGSTPFVLFRIRPFTLKSIFVTYTPDILNNEDEGHIKVEIIGKRFGSRKVFYDQMVLFKGFPGVFTPKRGFDKITKLSIKTADASTHLICLDNILLCA